MPVNKVVHIRHYGFNHFYHVFVRFLTVAEFRRRQIQSIKTKQLLDSFVKLSDLSIPVGMRASGMFYFPKHMKASC